MNKSEAIQDYIMKIVKRNNYKAGVKLPTEVELMDKFSVSKMTVNKALGVLRNKGYIYSERGKGTFINKKVIHKNLNELTSFTEEMRARGIEAKTEVLRFSLTSMGYEEEKAMLELESNKGIYEFIRLRNIEERPLALDITILNPDIVGEVNFGSIGDSLYEYLQAELGIVINYSVQKISAIKANRFISRHLQVAEGEPILHIKSVTYNEQDLPFEVVHTYYVHDAYEFEQVSVRHRY